MFGPSPRSAPGEHSAKTEQVPRAVSPYGRPTSLQPLVDNADGNLTFPGVAHTDGIKQGQPPVNELPSHLGGRSARKAV